MASTSSLRRWLRRGGVLAAGLALLVLGVGWGWGTWAQSRPPLPRLIQASGPLELREVWVLPWTTAEGEQRMRHDLRFRSATGSTVRAALSLPAEGSGPWPVLVVAGGFQTDLESLAAAGRHGPWALLAYGYPGTPQAWQEGPIVTKVPAIRRAALGIPGELAGLLEWAGSQPWAGSLHFGGFSLGAILGPATLAVAERRGVKLGSSVLVFGGADLGQLFDRNVPVPQGTAWAARFLTVSLLHSLDARHHLPTLRTRTLLLQAHGDRFIPEPSAHLMTTLKPEPKEVRWLEGGHMNPDDRAGTARIVGLCRGWLDAEVRRGDGGSPSAPGDGSGAATPTSSPAGR